MILVSGVIIPVNQVYIFRNLFLDLITDLGITGVFAAGCKAEEHIGPHKEAEAVFGTDVADLFQVLGHNFKAVLHTVLIQISAAAQIVCLVHADVCDTGGKAGREGLKHAVDELIDSIILCKENIVDVKVRLIFRPADNGI